jgi:hypothetical protein
MLKPIAGVVVGVVVWGLVAMGLDYGLRHFWPAYATVERAMLFTIPMMIARLLESAASTLFAGYIAAKIDGGGSAALIAGIILLIIFAPIHYSIWAHFPIWYHLTFLVSLPLLAWVGGRLARP